MSLYVASLNSGSNGNCYYVGNEREAVLIDAGISCRETERRMKRIGLAMQKVKAIFISHEHSDHIKGVEVLSKKYSLPVYITPHTHTSSRLFIGEHLTYPFIAGQVVVIGDLHIMPFAKLHDAADPHSFLVSCRDITVGVITDIGDACQNVTSHFKQCHAAFLEANYDGDLLQNGSYPFHLKRRISGGLGHLSNKKALDLFNTHKGDRLSHLFLSHLSRDNNDPELARNLFMAHAGQTEIIVASRYEETGVYHINGTNDTTPPGAERQFQFSLF